MPYSDPEKQKIACRNSMKKHREKERLGLVENSRQPPLHITPEEMKKRLMECDQDKAKYIAEREKYAYNTREYRNLTAYISKQEERKTHWKFYLTLRGVESHYSLSDANEKISECKQRIIDLYKKYDSENDVKKVKRINCKIKDAEIDLEEWNLLKSVLEDQVAT